MWGWCCLEHLVRLRPLTIVVIANDVIGTDNDLAVDSEGYQNITVAWQPAPPTLEFLRYLTNDISPGDTPGDCILCCSVLLWNLSNQDTNGAEERCPHFRG